MIWLFAAALAGTADFEHVRDAEGCVIAMRPEAHELGAAMRATCHWPEVSAEALAGLLADYPRYTDYIGPITASEVRRRDGGRALVYQRHELFGIADREVLLWMWQEGSRVRWTTADEPLVLARGSVRVPRNEGYWEVAPAPGGGAAVVHEIALDAGGSIPRWIVAMARTRGFVRVMGQVRAIARAEALHGG